MREHSALLKNQSRTLNLFLPFILPGIISFDSIVIFQYVKDTCINNLQEKLLLGLRKKRLLHHLKASLKSHRKKSSESSIHSVQQNLFYYPCIIDIQKSAFHNRSQLSVKHIGTLLSKIIYQYFFNNMDWHFPYYKGNSHPLKYI